jgi:hypothetical protein
LSFEQGQVFFCRRQVAPDGIWMDETVARDFHCGQVHSGSAFSLHFQRLYPICVDCSKAKGLFRGCELGVIIFQYIFLNARLLRIALLQVCIGEVPKDTCDSVRGNIFAGEA